MPYELSFRRRVPLLDRSEYINECCVGGDAIASYLLPLIRSRYEDVDTEQEDWGWFIWFRRHAVRLAIDIFTDDPDAGAFRIHLTSRIKRWAVFDKVADTPELDELRSLVVSQLEPWVEGPVGVERLEGDS
jgi:hypothetical protein